ncbi:papain-like cysteine protease family protein, partial [Streptomyces galilaeus]|uniref:papain-like cysteine protease family protein n=1 Tax=Streptomyces galilaeus TaxID=33899 RepID=UPI0038F666BB
FAQSAYETQQASEWCWAASISMIWAFYGHPVAQSEIVTNAFGELVNQGGQPWQIFQALNGQRVDDNGVGFQSTVRGLYDAMSGYDNISYTDI